MRPSRLSAAGFAGGLHMVAGMRLETAMARRKKLPPPDIVQDEVDNPYQVGPLKITVAVSTRDDPLRGMLARGQIDRAQYEAGRLWQKYREQSEVGGIRAIDTTKEPVDGGGAYPEPITDAQRLAVMKLNAAAVELGPYGTRLVESVLGRRLSIVQAAAERFMVSKRGELYIGRRLVECLETLAVLWGLAS